MPVPDEKTFTDTVPERERHTCLQSSMTKSSLPVLEVDSKVKRSCSHAYTRSPFPEKDYLMSQRVRQAGGGEASQVQERTNSHSSTKLWHKEIA